MSHPVVEQNLRLLCQGEALLRSLDPLVYAGSGEGTGARSGVGPQFRHCVDFYRCFLRGLPEGRVDYDHRTRDPLLEVDPQAAAAALEEIAGELRSLSVADLERPLTVSADRAPGEDLEGAWSRSSLGRELRALVSHTVHHYALIALLLRQQGIDPGAEFGVAPATLAHWQESPTCAP